MSGEDGFFPQLEAMTADPALGKDTERAGPGKRGIQGTEIWVQLSLWPERNRKFRLHGNPVVSRRSCRDPGSTKN